MPQYSIEADSYVETSLSNDEWLEFFHSKGWEELTSLIKEWRAGVNIQLRVATGEDLYRAQGVAQCIDSYLDMKESILQTPEKEIEDERPGLPG